jgi:hypothetical protein
MSFDMELLRDTDRAVLADIARSILGELTKIERQRADDFLEADAAGGVFSDYEFGFGDESPGRNLNGVWSGQTGITRGGIRGDEDFIPRYKRSEFLAQRLERRRRRGAESAAAESSPSVDGYAGTEKIFVSGDVVYSELSEMISEMVCRDARRYDGAFERY